MATMSARYTVIDGEVVAQERGGVRHQLVPDPLGSTVALYDDAGTKTDTFGYWPYGEGASRSGSTLTSFQFVGTAGYYRDTTKLDYVRARNLHKVNGRWLTQDPIGLDGGDLDLYVYAYVNPVSKFDSTGLFSTNAGCKAGCRSLYPTNSAKDMKLRKACEALCTSLGGNNCPALKARCAHLGRHPSEGSQAGCLALYQELCEKKSQPNPAQQGLANCNDAQLAVVCTVVAIGIVGYVVVCKRAPVGIPQYNYN
jgi:RHS repeat-associated protein